MSTPISLNDFNIKREDFNKICRICLSRNASENIFKLTYSNILLIQLYEILCGIRVRNTDNLPSNICKDCIARLVRYYDFQIKCQKIEDYLRTLLAQENGEQSEGTATVLPCIEDDLQPNSVYFVKRLNFDCDSHKNTVNIGETVFLSDSNESIPQLIDDRIEENSDNIIISHTETVIDDNCNVHEYFCSCRQSFTNLSDLFEHCSSLGHEAKIDKSDDHQNEIKHNAPIYHCIYCNNFYYDETELLEHFNLNHQIDGFSCELCSSKFLSLENVKKHAALHIGEIPYHCMECLEGFTEISQYKSHGFTHKPAYQVCEYCGNDYRNERKYRSHIRLKHSQNNHEQRRYLCDICGKSFATPQALCQHRSNLHSNNIYICDQCHRRFPTKLLLNRHCLIHTEVKQYQCKFCQKSFRHQPSLRSHLLLHIGKRPYACKMCPRRFTQSAHLRTHSFVHTGEKPYVCQYCDRKFALSGNLTTHVRLHTGERPYRCDDCGKDFIALNPLKKHRLTHFNSE